MKRHTVKSHAAVERPRVAMQELRTQLAEIAGNVQYGKNPIIITNYSRDAFALIPIEYLAILEDALEERADQAAAARALTALEDSTDEVVPYVASRNRRQQQQA
jgi:prevent-host-death family protein